MKKTSKRIITTLTAGAVVASMGVAFANNTDAQKIVLNGNVIEGAKVVVEGDKSYIPLRAVCEGLGFTVDWENDARRITVTKLPIYITCSPDYDGYTFARTAPMLLGDAPKLIDDTTYVPQNFVEEILKGTLEVVDNEYHIVYGEQNTAEISGTVCELVYEDEKLVQLVIGDKEDVYSQTAINLNEELTQKVVDLGIEEGTNVVIKTTEQETMSIPPQRVGVDIEIEVQNTVEISGTVCELVYEDEKLVKVVIGDKEDRNSQTVLNLNEELAQKVAKLEIQEGSKIVATTTDLETMSLPPQRVLVDIAIAE